jgi:hypothetical protein
MIRDRAVHAAHVARHATEVSWRDTSHRLQGLKAEAESLFRRGQASDAILVQRVRAKLGRFVSHPHRIEVDAEDGCVTLSGLILAHEVKDLLSAVSSISGVRSVDNRLAAHDSAEHISALQDGRKRPGDRWDVLQEQWAPATRLWVGAVGGALMAVCAIRRSSITALLGTLGFGLFVRGATNSPLMQLIRQGASEMDAEGGEKVSFPRGAQAPAPEALVCGDPAGDTVVPQI